jgi:hypothetical protein
MTGYYRSLSDGNSIYQVYKKGFDLYAQCVRCKTREVNNPFPIAAHNITRMIQWKSWEAITDPEEINQLKTNQ